VLTPDLAAGLGKAVEELRLLDRRLTALYQRKGKQAAKLRIELHDRRKELERYIEGFTSAGVHAMFGMDIDST
jgi:hypothetical protein